MKPDTCPCKRTILQACYYECAHVYIVMCIETRKMSYFAFDKVTETRLIRVYEENGVDGLSDLKKHISINNFRRLGKHIHILVKNGKLEKLIKAYRTKRYYGIP